MGLIYGSGRSPGGGHGNLPVFLPGESHGQKDLAGYSPRGCKESDMTEHIGSYVTGNMDVSQRVVFHRHFEISD